MGLIINYCIEVSNNEDKKMLCKTIDNVISPILHILIPNKGESITIGKYIFDVDFIIKDLNEYEIGIHARHDGHDYGLVINDLKKNGFK